MKNKNSKGDTNIILLFFYIGLSLTVFTVGLFSISEVKIICAVFFLLHVSLIKKNLLKIIKLLYSMLFFLLFIIAMQIISHYFLTGSLTFASVNHAIISNILISIMFSTVIVHYVKKMPFSFQSMGLIFSLQKRIMHELSIIPKKELIFIPKILSLLIMSAFDEYCIIKKRINVK